MISYEKEINENAMPHIFRYFRMIRQKESLLINFKFLGAQFYRDDGISNQD